MQEQKKENKPSLQVEIAGVVFQNPVLQASGTFGSGMEYGQIVDLSRLGGVVTKGVAIEPWTGNPTPRIAETPAGMLNAIGLQNPGIDVFLERDMPFLEAHAPRIVVNVCGHTIGEYEAAVEALSDTAADLLEINISCPNVKEGGIAFGTDPAMVERVTKALKRVSKKPLVMKLSPNVTDITATAKAAEAGGADALSLINTLTGMKIDTATRRFALANGTGGLSGPAVHPIAVRMVYQVSKAVSLPLIGMGGIETAEDAAEMMLAGATAIAVGMVNFYRPKATEEIVDGLSDYLVSQQMTDVRELIGAVR